MAYLDHKVTIREADLGRSNLDGGARGFAIEESYRFSGSSGRNKHTHHYVYPAVMEGMENGPFYILEKRLDWRDGSGTGFEEVILDCVTERSDLPRRLKDAALKVARERMEEGSSLDESQAMPFNPVVFAEIQRVETSGTVQKF